MSGMLVNGALFQIFWFACVINNGQWLALASVLLFVLIWRHRTLLSRYIKQGMPLLFGFGFDWLMFKFEFYHFSDGNLPNWLVVLWLGFAVYWLGVLPILLRLSRGWFYLLIGAAGVTSYFAAQALHSVSFTHSIISTLSLVLLQWLAIAWFARRLACR